MQASEQMLSQCAAIGVVDKYLMKLDSKCKTQRIKASGKSFQKKKFIISRNTYRPKTTKLDF